MMLRLKSHEEAKNAGSQSGALALFTQYPKQAFNVAVKAELFPAHIAALGIALT